MSLRTERLILVPFVVGPLSTNCYLLACPRTGSAAIIDPGVGSRGELEPILREADRLGLEVELILNTHGHPDHVAGDKALRDQTGARVMIHELDIGLLKEPLWRWLWPGLEPLEPDGLLEDGDVIEVGQLRLAVLHTPGHTRGSVCFYLEREGLLFSGDTLFAGSVGRTDLPESSWTDMASSLVKLMRLPERVRVYPGHGPPTTIGAEKRRNPFVKMALKQAG